MNPKEPPKYPSHSPLTELLHLLPFEQYMQDWPLDVADPTRLNEFCDFYEDNKLDDDTRFSLMQLIVFSLDDALRDEARGMRLGNADELEKRVESLLRRDFVLHIHTVNYWRCADDATDPDPLPEGEREFDVTPMMRRVWEECFRPEYNHWLDDSLA